MRKLKISISILLTVAIAFGAFTAVPCTAGAAKLQDSLGQDLTGSAIDVEAG